MADFLGVGAPVADSIVLCNLDSPGRATVLGANSPRDWDIRKGYGSSGATVVFMGINVSKFSVLIDLWDDPSSPISMWPLWEIFAKTCLGKPVKGLPLGTGPQALFAMDIKHPQINMEPLNIKSVVVYDVTQFVQDEYGLWTCEITFLEYRRALAALGRPNMAIPSIVRQKKPALTAADLELQAAEKAFVAELAK